MAQEATLLDYLHEVEHAAARIARLDGAIAEAVKLAPPKMRAVIEALQASGERTRRGGITKTGNAHLRRVVVEAAWNYRHRPAVGTSLRKRQEHVSEEVKEIAWKAQQRLHQRYKKLLANGKNKGVVVTAIGRELLGFIWAIGIKVEAAQKESLQRAA
jgi:transposase